jgi:hypothetical protein
LVSPALASATQGQDEGHQEEVASGSLPVGSMVAAVTAKPPQERRSTDKSVFARRARTKSEPVWTSLPAAATGRRQRGAASLVPASFHRGGEAHATGSSGSLRSVILDGGGRGLEVHVHPR